MRYEQIAIYKYDELSDAAKEKACMKYYDINVDGEYWYIGIIERFIFDIKKEYDVELDKDEIEFTGFSSQGDGASFTHEFTADEIESMLDKAKITFKHGLKKKFLESVNIFIKRYDYNYSHSNTVHADYEITNWTEMNSHPLICNYFEKIAEDLEYFIEDWKEDMCYALYNDLEEEYTYLTSKDAIEETLSENDYEFYENGVMY